MLYLCIVYLKAGTHATQLATRAGLGDMKVIVTNVAMEYFIRANGI